jgi:hypothetical protein
MGTTTGILAPIIVNIITKNVCKFNIKDRKA